MACHRAALLVLTVLVVASAQPIKEVVSDCGAIDSAFSLLQGQFANATTPAALSMTLTLNCTADWSGCSQVASFAPGKPANSTKQPKVTITINTNCKKGQNVTIPVPFPTDSMFFVSNTATNAPVSVSVTGPIIFEGNAINCVAAPNTMNTLKLKDVSVNSNSIGLEAVGLDSLSITGGSFSGSGEPIVAYLISKSVAVTKATFEGYNPAAISLTLPPNTKVSATGNTFKNAANPGCNAISVWQEGGKMNINLAKTTTDNSTSVPICITSPINITKPIVSVAGSVGITPTKSNRNLTPAGWPVLSNCTIAVFRSA